MNGGDQLMIKDNIITAISSFLSSEDLELYDLNIALIIDQQIVEQRRD